MKDWKVLSLLFLQINARVFCWIIQYNSCTLYFKSSRLFKYLFLEVKFHCGFTNFFWSSLHFDVTIMTYITFEEIFPCLSSLDFKHILFWKYFPKFKKLLSYIRMITLIMKPNDNFKTVIWSLRNQSTFEDCYPN